MLTLWICGQYKLSVDLLSICCLKTFDLLWVEFCCILCGLGALDTCMRGVLCDTILFSAVRVDGERPRNRV